MSIPNLYRLPSGATTSEAHAHALLRGGELAGAERLWRVRVTAAWRRRAALPLRWRLDEYAPQLERTGRWDKVEA